jgi:TonB family protein
MPAWNENALFAELAGWAFKSAAIFGVAWLIAVLLRRRSAAARHMVWTGAAAAILVLPLLSLALPALRVSRKVLPDVVFTATATSMPQTSKASAPAASNTAHSNAPQPWRPEWRFWLMLLWAGGAANSLAQMSAAYAAVRRARRTATRFNVSGFTDELSRQLGIRRGVAILESAPGSMPMATGGLRPAVFLPADAAQWPEERRRLVLLHELAHVHRADVWWQGIARTALALHWWNPLAWKAWRELLRESERAADDLVLNAGASATGYASELLAAARSMRGMPHLKWAALAMARPSQLENRLAAILDSRIDRRVPRRAFVSAAVVIATMTLAPLAAIRAQDNTVIPPDIDAAVRIAASQKNYEILEDAAKAAEKQGKYDAARQLLQPAVNIRAEKAGANSVEYAVGLMKLGDLESLRGNDKSAEDFYSRAVPILGDKPAAVGGLMYLGKASLKQKEYSRAADYFQRAEIADPARAGDALLWSAIAQQRQGNLDQAEALYKTALLRQVPNSTGAAATMLIYAKFLRQQNREDEAKEAEVRAIAAQKASAVTPQVNALRIGPGVSAPVPVQKGEPQYSEDARIAQLSGTVVVSIVVGTDGLAHDIQVVRGLGLGLDEKAVEALGKWTFKPAIRDGQPVPVAATIEINFRLL